MKCILSAQGSWLRFFSKFHIRKSESTSLIAHWFIFNICEKFSFRFKLLASTSFLLALFLGLVNITAYECLRRSFGICKCFVELFYSSTQGRRGILEAWEIEGVGGPLRARAQNYRTRYQPRKIAASLNLWGSPTLKMNPLRPSGLAISPSAFPSRRLW